MNQLKMIKLMIMRLNTKKWIKYCAISMSAVASFFSFTRVVLQMSENRFCSFPAISLIVQVAGGLVGLGYGKNTTNSSQLGKTIITWHIIRTEWKRIYHTTLLRCLFFFRQLWHFSKNLEIFWLKYFTKSNLKLYLALEKINFNWNF